MINTQPIVKADLFHKANVGTNEQRQQLIAEIKHIQELNPTGSLNSNDGCWRWSNPCSNVEWLFKEITDLLNAAIDMYSKEDLTFKNFVSNSKTLSATYWANVNAPKSRNVFHTHKEDHFSCVYYLQAENTGDLRLTNPGNILGDCNNTAPFVRDFSFTPAPGDLILWPAWVPHEVETNLSNIERINLVFNIKLV